MGMDEREALRGSRRQMREMVAAVMGKRGSEVGGEGIRVGYDEARNSEERDTPCLYEGGRIFVS